MWTTRPPSLSLIGKARKPDLMKMCESLGLGPEGTVAELRERLRSHLHPPQKDMRRDVKMKPWQKKDWREKRKKILKERGACEWCGSEEYLTTHHHTSRRLPFSTDIRAATHQVMREAIRKGEFEWERVKCSTCPGCQTLRPSHIYKRKKKRPKYRCMRCGTEFSETVWRYKELRRLSKKDWKRFWNKYGKEIHETVSREREAHFDRYEELRPEDILVLCRRCSFATHKGLVLCPECKYDYMRPGFKTCYGCSGRFRMIGRLDECVQGPLSLLTNLGIPLQLVVELTKNGRIIRSKMLFVENKEDQSTIAFYIERKPWQKKDWQEKRKGIPDRTT